MATDYIYQAIEGYPTNIVRDITKEECEARMRDGLAFRIVVPVSFSFSRLTGRIYHIPNNYDPAACYPPDLCLVKANNGN